MANQWLSPPAAGPGAATAASGNAGAPGQDTEAVKVSALLARLAAGAAARIALGDVLDALRERGFALLILLLALPNAIPGPALPGLSTITGLPLALVALQLALGRIEPRLPRWVRRKSLSRTKFAALVERVQPMLKRLEAVVRPRLLGITGKRGERLLGVWVVVAALVLSLPLPLGNLPMACGLIVLALALMERDGAAVLVGLVMTVLGVAWNVALLWAGAEIVGWIRNWLA